VLVLVVVAAAGFAAEIVEAPAVPVLAIGAELPMTVEVFAEPLVAAGVFAAVEATGLLVEGVYCK
jgi:hypothetical protein